MQFLSQIKLKINLNILIILEKLFKPENSQKCILKKKTLLVY